MPQTKLSPGVYDFGAPVAIGTVLQFRTKPNTGGKLTLKFENPEGANDGTVSVEVSADNSSWAATTAANNLAAVTSVSVPKKVTKEATILIRRGTDNYVRVRALGGCRMQLQIRGDHLLEPMTI